MTWKDMNRSFLSLKGCQESIFWLSFCDSLSVKYIYYIYICIILPSKSQVGWDYPSPQIKRCECVRDWMIWPPNWWSICFGHVMKLCLIFENNSYSNIQNNRYDDKTTFKVTAESGLSMFVIFFFANLQKSQVLTECFLTCVFFVNGLRQVDDPGIKF